MRKEKIFRDFSPRKEILLLIETSRSFAWGIVHGISRYNRLHGQWNLFHPERNIQEALPDWFKNWKGDGIISRCGSTDLCRQLEAKGVPVIELMGDGDQYPCQIEIDRYGCAQMAADHLWKAGFRNIAFFTLGYNWWSIKHLRSFEESLKQYGLTCISPPSLPETDTSLPLLWDKKSSEETGRWLRSLPKPVAIYSPRDIHAVHLMKICQQNRLGVPEEVALLGMGNNTDLCRWTTPSLSSIEPNGNEIGYQAARLLDEALAGSSSEKKTILVPPIRVVERNSTRFMPIRNKIVLQAIEFMKENLQFNPSVSEIARRVGVSRCTLNRLFMQDLGIPPGKELFRRKMNFARELLEETEMNTAQIAEYLDFQSSSSFIRAFHRYFHRTTRDRKK